MFLRDSILQPSHKKENGDGETNPSMKRIKIKKKKNILKRKYSIIITKWKAENKLHSK